MRSVLVTSMLLCCVSLPGLAQTQDRFESGPHKGFTKSPTEHIIVELEKPFEVLSIHGVIKDPSGYPMPEVVFEIRDQSGKVMGVKTSKSGKFRMSGVSVGTYSFKATKDGFQSVIGEIVVTGKANRKAAIEITMPLGD